MNDPKHDAAWHGTETAQPKPTAAEVAWTPTTDEVRNFWAAASREDVSAFDRWLAEHDAQVLRAAAREVQIVAGTDASQPQNYALGLAADRIDARADRIAGGAT